MDIIGVEPVQQGRTLTMMLLWHVFAEDILGLYLVGLLHGIGILSLSDCVRPWLQLELQIFILALSFVIHVVIVRKPTESASF